MIIYYAHTENLRPIIRLTIRSKYAVSLHWYCKFTT